MNAWQDVRCPKCDKLFFQAFGISAHLVIRIVCRCGRVVEIKEGFLAEVVGDANPSRTTL